MFTPKSQKLGLETPHQDVPDEEMFVDAAPIGRLHMDTEGMVIHANPWWYALTGSTREQSSGDGWLKTVHPDDRGLIEAEWHTAVDEGREMSAQFRVLRTDGIELAVFMRAAPVETAGGDVAGFTAVLDDVTDRVRMQEALARSEARYRLLAEHSTDFISRHTPSGVYTYASPICETLLGYLPSELVGTSAYEHFHPDDLKRIAASHDRVLATPDISTVAYRIRRKDGTYTWFETTARTVRDEGSGEITEIIAVSRDITERRKAEETDRLEHLLYAKDRFLATVSHELRTPLTSLVGFAEILRTNSHSLTERERDEFIETLSRESADLAAIIDDLLVLTRADHGTLALASVPVDLKAQAAQVLEAMGLRDRIPIEVDGDPARAEGDPARIRQILRNLINNAIAYGEDPIRIQVGLDGATIHIAVINAGRPIPQEVGDRIFEPYHRVGGDSGKPDSMGLGLTVSRTLARLMGGQLTYEPGDGGNTFLLSLPALSNVVAIRP
ncbi:MAG TPA: PAS domain-containing sensor histidine kinase [Acidimicrobiia bacterium]